MSFNPFSLNNKTVLVTGASSGLGQHTAISLSKMGATLIITGRDQNRLENTLSQLEGENHIAYSCDLTNKVSQEQLLENMPQLNGLFYSAGIAKTIPLKYCDDKSFEEVYAINVFAPLQLTRALLKKKLLKPGASLLYLSSIASMLGFPGQGAYASSKASLSSLVRVLASEVASNKIRANSLCPGNIFTPLLDNSPVNSEQLRQDQTTYPLGYGEPQDIANAALYFLSDASKWVTGVSFVMDGGLTLR